MHGYLGRIGHGRARERAHGRHQRCALHGPRHRRFPLARAPERQLERHDDRARIEPPVSEVSLLSRRIAPPPTQVRAGASGRSRALLARCAGSRQAGARPLEGQA